MNPETITEAGFAAVAIGCAICLAWLILRDVLAEQERKRPKLERPEA